LGALALVFGRSEITERQGHCSLECLDREVADDGMITAKAYHVNRVIAAETAGA
jgi:hypothetical protein